MTNPNSKIHAVSIPVPFGTISGVWYGPSNIRPILFIHGFCDNSGTFERLIPLLPAQYSYLAVDLPGHGMSSPIPQGMMYHWTDTALVILWIMRVYKWPKVSLVGHSLGAIMCYIFIGLHPEKVDLFVALDALQLSYPSNVLEHQTYLIERFVEADSWNEPRELHSYENLVDKIHNGANEIPREFCHHLLSRNIVESKVYPNKFHFRHDRRISYPFHLGWSERNNVQTANLIKFPILIIKASDSIHYGDEEEFSRIIEIIRSQNANLTLIHVKGCHYVHLINPEKVAHAIVDFLGTTEYIKSALQSKL
ncbi:serine hydrolase-like protein [Malaya genurostris]|uniref:serine hydrolase-like protein n=1 Tax=Malaya genurostris TaxID=325434 RepID=UPI0026F3CEEA|nr:serine hydrolase-like protein [Malaya genurostris]